MIFTCPVLGIGMPIDSTFCSFGIHKTEELTFLNDSICVYKQIWDSSVFDGMHNYIDTFLYSSCGYQYNMGSRIEKFIIKTTSEDTSDKNYSVPIDEKYYKIMDIQIPRTVLFYDINTGSILSGELRRSRYNMWDMPRYTGKKSKLSMAYATLFNIAMDTIYLYDNHVLRFGFSNILLYSQAIMDNITFNSDSIGSLSKGLLEQERQCYEYQMHCKQSDRAPLPRLDKTDLIGRYFYSYSQNHLQQSTTAQILYFTEDSCYVNKNEQITSFSYQLKNNLIVLKNFDNVTTENVVADTLAYNSGFIFYAKSHYIVESDIYALSIRVFHEIKPSNHPLPRHWRDKSNNRKHIMHYTYPEYKTFNQICLDTYIPINL